MGYLELCALLEYRVVQSHKGRVSVRPILKGLAYFTSNLEVQESKTKQRGIF